MTVDEPTDDGEPAVEPLHRWAVTYQATVSKTLVVEARSYDEAVEAADREFDPPYLCGNYCAREMDLSDWYPVEDQWGVVDEGPVE